MHLIFAHKVISEINQTAAYNVCICMHTCTYAHLCHDVCVYMYMFDTCVVVS